MHQICINLHNLNFHCTCTEFYYPNPSIWDFPPSLMSRSAAAANKLEQAGYSNVACITSGLQTVKPGLSIHWLVLFVNNSAYFRG